MTENDSTKQTAFSRLSESASTYIRLLIEDTKLNMVEKLTRLLSAIAMCSLLTILITAALVFISIAAGLALSTIIPPLWAFIIVAGFYIIVMILLICYRTRLLVNPIARFISRLLLDAPKSQNPESNDKSASVS
jgi:hypothetical protein